MGKNKGKISRFLANKCAMAARLDHYLVNVII
jgi:RNA processing factor Prp31